MITIKVDTKGLDATIARLRGLPEKKINVAAVAALNDGAREGYEASRKEMQRVFDLPTPWVLGGVRYIRARKDKLEARVDFDKWGNKTNVTVEKVLDAQIKGSERRHKRHEIALQRAGVLPSGMAIVPGSAAQMDRYGNMRSSQIVQILAWFNAFPETGSLANMTDRTRAGKQRDNKRTGARGFAYFALQRPYGKLPPGVYQRIKTGFGSAVRPVMIFIKTPRYKRRFDFYGVAERAALRAMNQAFPRYLAQLLKERGL